MYFPELEELFAETDLSKAMEISRRLEIPAEIPPHKPIFTPQTTETMFGINYDPTHSLKEMSLSQAYQRAGMYALVSWAWVTPLAEWIGDRKVLEVLSGRGWLAYALREKGIDLIATDNFSWGQSHRDKALTEVIEMDALDAVEKYGESTDILILSWPPYGEEIAYRAMKKLYDINPNAVIVFIGEGSGGCTADDNFFDHFEPLYNDSFSPVIEGYESWHTLHDCPQLGRYRK